MAGKAKRELSYTPPPGAVEWVVTPTQRVLASNPVTVVAPVRVWAQTWFDARHEGAKLLGLPVEHIHVKRLDDV